MLFDTTIVITTHDREHKQITLNSLPEPIRKRTRLAIYKYEEENYRSVYPKQPYWLMPIKVKGLHAKRQFLIENTKTRYLLLMDDDFRFCYRPDLNSSSLVYLEPDSIKLIRMFETMRNMASDYAHVGISHRSGNHNYNKAFKFNTRIAGVFLYDLSVLRREKIKLGRVVLMDDFDTILQLLRKGLSNVVLYRWCYNHIGNSNSKGGCSNYRTIEMQNRDAIKLAELHYPFVKLMTKKSTTWRNMTERTDVRIYWKKAYESSKTLPTFADE